MTQTQFFDKRLIPTLIFIFQISQKRTAFRDHGQKAPAGMIVFLIGFEMFRQCLDAVCEDRDLNFGRSGITGFCGIFSAALRSGVIDIVYLRFRLQIKHSLRP